jgi:hypothetical protein
MLGQSSIQSGKSTTLSWNAPGSGQVTITGAGIFGSSGSTAVSPAETTTYNLIATYSDGASQSASATLIVEAAEPPYLLYGLIGFGLLAIMVLAAAVIVYLRVKKLTAQPAVQSSNVESVRTVSSPSPISTIPSSSQLATSNEANTRVTALNEPREKVSPNIVNLDNVPGDDIIQSRIRAAREPIVSGLPKPHVRIRHQKAKPVSTEVIPKDDQTEGPIDEQK